MHQERAETLQATSLIPSHNEIIGKFLRFADSAKNVYNSRLYYHLSLALAGDNDLLSLAQFAPVGQPVPQLLFGAVHYLLAFERSDPLACYYPSFSG